MPAPASTQAAPDALRTAVRDVLDRQRRHHPTVRARSARERAAVLGRLREAVLDHRAAFHDALHADFGKSPIEVDLSEIASTLIEARFAQRHVKAWMAPTTVGTPLTHVGTSSEIRYEPKGVGLIISPWNYPVILALGPLVSAVAAGCCAVLKPSEFTPQTSALLKRVLGAVFPDDEVAVFEGDHVVAQTLLAERFDHVYFTGSPEVGKIVMRAAAEQLASVTLELGGKSPTLVDATADLDDAARKIVWGKFTNAGQTCIAPDYVYVEASVRDALVERLRAQIDAFYGADDVQHHSPDYARLVHQRHVDRTQRLLEEAVADGARVAAGGRVDPERRFVAPTVLTDVPLTSRVMQEEIFAPLLPVLAYHDLDDALQMINSREKPLALYIFSRDDAAVETILNHTTAGGTCVNETLMHFNHPELPFGGVNYSGIGKGYGHHGFLEFSNARPVLRRRWGSRLFDALYPPYGRRTQQAVDLLLRWT